MTNMVMLREVNINDLPTFFEQQQDPDANQMAAFTSRNPSDQKAFNVHWQKIMADDSVMIRTIIFKEQVAGYILSYLDEGKPEVGYWIGQNILGERNRYPCAFRFFIFCENCSPHIRPDCQR